MGSLAEKETQTDTGKRKKDNGKHRKEKHEKLKTFITYITMSGGGGNSPPLTTHILDTARGQPARDVAMVLSKLDQSGQWQTTETGVTNSDGRGGFFGSSVNKWTTGTYKLHFDTGAYFTSLHTKGFYPYVEVVFQIDDPDQHYHVPLLLSPYGYSTYRGS